MLVDTSPDLREQLLCDADVKRLDGILLTHSHADHTHGIDDIRPLVIMARRKIDLHMDAPTSAVVRAHFDYIFATPPGSQYPPLLNERRLAPGDRRRGSRDPAAPIEAMPFRLDHGEIDALGFRFGDIAYTPDLNGIPAESLQYLEGLDLWIVDALRYMPHPSHFSVARPCAGSRGSRRGAQSSPIYTAISTLSGCAPNFRPMSSQPMMACGLGGDELANIFRAGAERSQRALLSWA